MGVSLLLSCNQQNTEQESVMSDTSVVSEVAEEEKDVLEETDSIVEENTDEEFSIRYYCEEMVKDNPLFESFLNNKMDAYDYIGDSRNNMWSIGVDMDFYYGNFYENKFHVGELYEAYYEKYGESLIGVQVRSRDLNNDGKNELLILIEYKDCGIRNGDLHVFHEEDGKLYEWECWGNIVNTYGLSEIYEKGGILTRGLLTKYNDDGYIEVIFDGESVCESIGAELVDSHYYKREKYSFRYAVYNADGSVITYRWEEIHYENGSSIIKPEHQLIKDEVEEIRGKLLDEQGEDIYIYHIWNIESAEWIAFAELME